VQVLANANTGLAASDVHFWGNLVGETTDTTPAGNFARTLSADGGAIITNGTQADVGITNRLDVNKNNSISMAADRGPIAASGTGTLERISISAGSLFPASVAAAHIFYNQSAFDGNDAAAGAADDSAIAPDKSAYLPGSGQAVLANLTNYDKGITGVMVDLAGNHGPLSLADFAFKVGANNTPGSWAAAPGPSGFLVRAGAGVGGSDRIEITWAAGAIRDTWLEVQVLANANTNLAVSNVHFWGNLVGETASTTPAGNFARTVSADGGAIITNGTQGSVGITSFLDVNRSNSISVAADRGPIVTAGTGSLVRISIAGGGPFAPEGGVDVTDHSAIATALGRPASSAEPLPSGGPWHSVPTSSASAAAVVQIFQLLDDPSTASLADAEDDLFPPTDAALDSDVLDDLLTADAARK
jgi:hypothetical protein